MFVYATLSQPLIEETTERKPRVWGECRLLRSGGCP